MTAASKRNRTAAFYEAGRAVALAALGLPAPALALENVRRMKPRHAERELAKRIAGHLPLPAAPDDVEHAILPPLAGTAAILIGCGSERDQRITAKIALELNSLGAVIPCDTISEANAVWGAADQRAQKLINGNWSIIDQIAQALLTRKRLAADQVTALLASDKES